MKIAIIGAGNVGAALGSGWAKRNHDVIFGVRDTKKTNSATNAETASVMEASQSSDVVVLAVPWPAVGDALKSAGDLTGKILIDATNPLLPDLSGLDTKTGTSGGEMVASLSRGAGGQDVQFHRRGQYGESGLQGTWRNHVLLRR